MTPAAIFALWHSSERGLTSAEAQRRLAEVGPNEPARQRRGAALSALLAFLANPLVLILLVASGVSALLRDVVNAVLIALIVVLSVLLNFVQTYRSQRATERLREAVAPTASVLRDRVWREIARHDLVPGDIIRLTAGDQVPADARLLETRDLHLQQAALTGESLPVRKTPARCPPRHGSWGRPRTWYSWAPRW
jgi:Mg2+-importing ATPase